MPTIQQGDRYDGEGTLYRNGQAVLSFDRRINPELDELFDRMSQLIGVEVDISALPDSITVGGVVYDINYLEDVQQELVNLIDAWEVEFGWTEAKVKRVLRPLMILLRALHREGWF